AGRLSRVLYETATDARRAPPRGVRAKADRAALELEAERALRSIDQASAQIEHAMVGATHAGLAQGLEGAARSVQESVGRVAALPSGGARGRDALRVATAGEPLADLMRAEHEDERAHREAEHAVNAHPHASLVTAPFADGVEEPTRLGLGGRLADHEPELG